MTPGLPLQLLLVCDPASDELALEQPLKQHGLDFSVERADTLDRLDALLHSECSALLYHYASRTLPLDEVLARLRKIDPELPIILVAAEVSENMVIDLVQQGLSDFVLEDKLARLPGVLERVLAEAARQRESRERHDQLRKFALAVEQSPASIIITDTTPVIEYVNEAFCRNSGYAREEVLGRNPNLLNLGLTPRKTYTELWETLGRGEVWQGELHNTRKDGTDYIEAATIAPVREPDGRISHYVAIKSDITDERRSESLIHRLSHFDSLTGLANRSQMLKRLEQSAAAMQRTGRHGMLIVLDIDGFKFINDLHGYQAGDALLLSVTQRLRDTLTDESMIARIGGNRFAVVVENLSRRRDRAVTQAHDLAELIHAELQDPHFLEQDGVSIRHATTMGLCLLSTEPEAADRLLNKAEIALQRARDESGNNWRFFKPDMQTVVEERAEVESGLHEALEKGRLRLFYQSLYDAEGRLTGVEALIRWVRPDGQMVPPDRFIPLAEETGLILPIGAWVVETACAKLREWSQNPETAELFLSINISARQFHQPRFVESLLKVMDDYDIEPGRLVLELTESVVLNDMGHTEQRMLAIRDLGIGLALDDFGTGFSSLSYLKSLPFDTLKIDRSFVSDMLGSESSAAIVQATISMGHALGLKVTAEGVENKRELSLLRRFGCDSFQGFLFARPLPPEDWAPADQSLD